VPPTGCGIPIASSAAAKRAAVSARSIASTLEPMIATAVLVERLGEV